jgi:hypothetical protein
MSEITRRAFFVSGATLAAGFAATSPAEAAIGSIYMKIVSAGFIIGATGGDGVFTFGGRQYPITVGGISAGFTIGASGTDLVGTASHVHDPRDIEGIYSQVAAGVAVAGGRSVARLSNAKGVVLRLHGRQVGFMFSVDLSGMSIAFK